MSVTINVKVTRRNPSGLHNKIKWILSKSLEFKKNVYHLQEWIMTEDFTFEQRFSWTIAFISASFIIDKSRFFTKETKNKFISLINYNDLKQKCVKSVHNYKKASRNNIIIIEREIKNLFNDFLIKISEDEGCL